MWLVTVYFFKGDVQHGNDESKGDHKEAKESTESKEDLLDSKILCITSGHNIIRYAVSLYLGFEDTLTQTLRSISFLSLCSFISLDVFVLFIVQ